MTGTVKLCLSVALLVPSYAVKLIDVKGQCNEFYNTIRLLITIVIISFLQYCVVPA